MATNRRLKQLRDAVESIQQAPKGLESLDAARRVREAAEALEREHVDAARKAGFTWSQIGVLYGMSKQGAQQRFRHEDDGPGRKPRRKAPAAPSGERGAASDDVTGPGATFA